VNQVSNGMPVQFDVEFTRFEAYLGARWFL